MRGQSSLISSLCASQNIKEGIEGHAANWYSDVFGLVFPNLDPDQVNNRWKEQLAKQPEKVDIADEGED